MTNHTLTGAKYGTEYASYLLLDIYRTRKITW